MARCSVARDLERHPPPREDADEAVCTARDAAQTSSQTLGGTALLTASSLISNFICVGSLCREM